MKVRLAAQIVWVLGAILPGCVTDTSSTDEIVMDNVSALQTRTGPTCNACPANPDNAPPGYSCKLVEDDCNSDGHVCSYQCLPRKTKNGTYTTRIQ